MSWASNSMFVLYIVISLVIIDVSLVEKRSQMSLTDNVTNIPSSQITLKKSF